MQNDSYTQQYKQRIISCQCSNCKLKCNQVYSMAVEVLADKMYRHRIIAIRTSAWIAIFQFQYIPKLLHRLAASV